MASNFKPRIVADVSWSISAEDSLRSLITRRDSFIRDLALIDAEIAKETRRYADERGLTMRPRIEQLRRELMQ